MVTGLNSGLNKRFISFQNLQICLRDSNYMDNGVLFLGVKRQKSEADHLPQSSAKVKNEWRYTSIPRLYLHDVYRSDFTFNVLRHNWNI